MTDTNLFDLILLIARPAAGKSEIIDYLKRTSPDERARRFHVGRMEEIDDFPMLWTWFEEDALLERMGRPRLHTDRDGYFLHQYLWDLLIERIGLEYEKKRRDLAAAADSTFLIEFSRGTEHGGNRSARTVAAPTPAAPTASWSTRCLMRSWSGSTRRSTGPSSPAPTRTI